MACQRTHTRRKNLHSMALLISFLLFVLLRCHPCLFFVSFFFSSFLSINGMLIYADKLKPKSTSLDKLTCWSILAIPSCVFPHINTSYLFLSYFLRRLINNLCGFIHMLPSVYVVILITGNIPPFLKQ